MCKTESLFSRAVLNERQCLLYKVIALTELVDGLMNQVLGNVIKAVREIVQLLCVMAVVAEHISEQSQGFLRRGCCSMAVRMSGAVRMNMLVSVSAVLVTVYHGIVFRVIVVVHFALLFLYRIHGCPASGYSDILLWLLYRWSL